MWFAKEKASVEAIKEKANAYNDEVGLLSSELSKVRNEMLLIRKEYEALEERMKRAEEHAEIEKTCRCALLSYSSYDHVFVFYLLLPISPPPAQSKGKTKYGLGLL